MMRKKNKGGITCPSAPPYRAFQRGAKALTKNVTQTATHMPQSLLPLDR